MRPRGRHQRALPVAGRSRRNARSPTTFLASDQDDSVAAFDLAPQLVDHAAKLVDHPAGAASVPVGLEQLAVVPEVVLWVLSVEALPERRPMSVVVAQHRPRVVELVGDGDKQSVVADLGKVLDVLALAVEPRSLRLLVGVTAFVDDARDVFAEVGPALVERPGA